MDRVLSISGVAFVLFAVLLFHASAFSWLGLLLGLWISLTVQACLVLVFEIAEANRMRRTPQEYAPLVQAA